VTFDYLSQPKEELRACPLCGGCECFTTVGDWDRFGLPVKSVRCRVCDLVFLNPRMTRDAYRVFYANGHYRELLKRQVGWQAEMERLEPFQAGYAKNLIRWLEPHISGRSVETMLDIGGSSGVVAWGVAKAFGCEGAILEPSQDEAQRALARGLRVMLGTIEDYEPDGERFDLVLLCQTIDHLLDISGSLRTIHALLEDDGLFFVDVVTSGVRKIDHPFYLSRETATAFFEGAGFKVLHEAPGGRHYRFLCEKA